MEKIEEKINLLLQLGADATYLEEKKYGELCALSHKYIEIEWERNITGVDNDKLYSFDYVILKALGWEWNRKWEAIFDSQEKIINLYRATVLIERHFQDKYDEHMGFSSSATSIISRQISEMHLNIGQLVHWVNKYRSSNTYSKARTSLDYLNKKGRDEYVRNLHLRPNQSNRRSPLTEIDPTAFPREKAIKLIEEKYSEMEQSSHRQIIFHTLKYRDDPNTDVLQDLLDGKLKFEKFQGQPIRFGFFSDEEIFDIAMGIKNYSLEESKKILLNCSCMRLRAYIQTHIEALENR